MGLKDCDLTAITMGILALEMEWGLYYYLDTIT